jgi:hypothetical protein
MVTITTSSGPRARWGANSEAMVPAMANSAPIAMPMPQRSTTSCHGSWAKNRSTDSRMNAAMSAR